MVLSKRVFNVLWFYATHAGVEIVGPRWRVLTGTVVYYFWVVGYFILAALAYFIRDWRMLLIAGSLFGLPFVAHIW